MIYTDEQLQQAFSIRGGKRVFRATYCPSRSETSCTLWDERLFAADNKKDAVKIAREYGARILNKTLLYVYLVPKREYE